MNKMVSYNGIGYVAATYPVDSATKTILQANFVNPKTGNVDINGKNLAVRLNVSGQVGFGEVDEDAGTAGIYTLTISTLAAVGDKIKIGETELTFVANDATPTGNQVKVGATPAAAEQAANIVTFLNAQSAGLKDTFTIAASTNTVTFTQKVKGEGDKPSVTVTKVAETGTLVATIATTTEGELAYSVDDALFGIIMTYEKDGYAAVQTSGYVDEVPTIGALNAGVKSLVANNRGKLVSISSVASRGMTITPSTEGNLEATVLL